MSGLRRAVQGVWRVLGVVRRRARFRVYRAHLGWILHGLPPPPAQLERRVLLVRTDLIGDFLLWAHAGQALAAHYRAAGYVVVLVVNADCAELARAFDLADEILPLQRRRFVADLAYRGAMLRRIAVAGFCEVVQTAYSREAFIEDALVIATRAPSRIGFAAECYNLAEADQALSDACYSRRIRVSPDPCMELLRNAQLLRAFALPGYRSGVARLPPDPEALPEVLRGMRYAVLFAGASDAAKRWPVERFCAVGRQIAAEFGLRIVVAGGPGDSDLGRRISADLAERTIDLCGRTTLPQLAEVLRNARILVSNDTSAAHLAAIVGTPAVCIAGGWQGTRFLPYEVEVRDERALPVAVAHVMACWNCRRNCIYPVPRDGPFECIAQVAVTPVWEAIRAVLG